MNLRRRSRFPIACLFAVCGLSPALLAQPKRIVSTAPSFTETLFALGAGSRVVGVSIYCHFPQEVARIAKVGSYTAPDIEAIVRLKPDLVLVHKEQPEVTAQLNRVGIKTLALLNTSLEDTFTSIREVGAALQMTAEATQLERSIRGRFAALQKAAAGRPKKTLLFVLGRTPNRLEGLIAVGKGSFLNELITIAGGRNAFADSPVTYPTISLEGVLRIDPDVVVDMGDMTDTEGVTEAHRRDVVALWQKVSSLKAVKTKHVYAVAADIYVVPGPRIADAAESFAKMLQGQP